MRMTAPRFLMVSLALLLGAETASACHKCHKNPCAYAPAPVAYAAPAYQCVTEMVPTTVYKQRTRIEHRTITETIMTRVPETTYVDRQRTIYKPIWETVNHQRTVYFCRPVTETKTITESYTVCNPVTTTRTIVECYLQPSYHWATVPAMTKCGHGCKSRLVCSCATVLQTCYTPVSTTREVTETHYVAEVKTRQVPVTWTHYVQESKVETFPVKQCRIVTDVVTDRIPVTTIKCVPKTITRHVAYPVCETYAETCYYPVTRYVPCGPVAYEAAPQPGPAPQPTPGPTPQAGPTPPAPQKQS